MSIWKQIYIKLSLKYATKPKSHEKLKLLKNVKHVRRTKTNEMRYMMEFRGE
jgi:hypothetical protein